ncbi:DUF3322 domain-containing protein [Lysobacter capsici]|uniref:DUF3322 domain-containing protein n=1 Tax=Lysobacter capsici TaxID=435897 RepID=UPI000BBAF1C6|nr:DUF3322 domain-containing protein [Lysobacter capsici]ATE71282.1 hypothetical protein CNO08_07880 [Lysobacter capsici]
MKSPADLAKVLAREWDNADYREQRLLNAGAWPIPKAIGKPTARSISDATPAVREHLERWRMVGLGEVEWEEVSFRSAAEPVRVPITWLLHEPAQWVVATGDASVSLEYSRLQYFMAHCDVMFHRLLLRNRSLWRNRSDTDVVHAAEVALRLSPGCAAGRPLRSMPVAEVDTKFFERNRSLVVALLDVRFDGAASQMGLEAFVGALDEGDHWLLVAPLEPGLLPFVQQRVRARELMESCLPGETLLVVENERCLYQLPPLSGTIAILGAGLNLGWMRAAWLADRRIGYWGDMDTWGLLMLARARNCQPHVETVLMHSALFDAYAKQLAVVEPVIAGACPAAGLNEEEGRFYLALSERTKGRLEQEFLPKLTVVNELHRWFCAAGDDAP